MSSHAFFLAPPLPPISGYRRGRRLAAAGRSDLPILPIPGGYGPPVLGAIRDRLDYHYFQGPAEFFSSRVKHHGSTVLRLNMPPGPFVSGDSRVVALLDAASFPTLFDVSSVDKRDVFTGTYIPNVALTGGHRMLAYLDPSEPSHAAIKRFLFHLLASTRHTAVPAFRRAFGDLLESLESELLTGGKPVAFADANDRASFRYVSTALLGVDPAGTDIGADAPALITKWVFLQLGPILSLGLPPPLEELLLHTFPLPAFLVQKDYDRLFSFFRAAGARHLDEAERMGISRDEACHNLLFAACFNMFGGMKILFPAILKWVGLGGAELHAKLAAEIRGAVAGRGGGEVTVEALEEMELTKSVVYEVLRLEPPVPLQYGRAKRDLVVRSHDAAYEVKKGELLFGFQPFATRDERVFRRAHEFLPERFVGEEGRKLLRYVLWSNGPETESPSTENKQCAGKDIVVLMARLLVVEIFMRFDGVGVNVGKSALGSAVNITYMKKRRD